MEDAEIGRRSGIPRGHKFFAVLLGAAVAAAGCAWLIYQSRRSAATAVLAFDPGLAQKIDPGVASAKNPAVVLANSALNDRTVARLAKQAHLAASTPAGQVGEFRSDLQLTQPSALRLDVRFQTADSSQSMSVANDVARVLAGWNPASAATSSPAQSQFPAVAPAQQPAPANQGQSRPPAASTAGPQPTPPREAPADHPLSEALNKLGAQLSATDLELDRMGTSSSGGGSSYIESTQQTRLRTEVREAQSNLADLRTRYASEVANPNIRARLDEIQQALDSILSGGHRSGFNAAGVSTWQLNAERSELRQTIHIVHEETRRVQIEEAAHPTSITQQKAPASPPSPAATVTGPPTSSSAPSPAGASSSSSGIQEENIPATAEGGQAQQSPSGSPLSVVRLAAPAPRPPLWSAFVAGALCCLIYFGIAAFAYRRTERGDLEPEISSAPQRMITFADPISVDESPDAPPEHPRFETAQRQRAAFVFVPAPGQQAPEAAEKPATAEEESHSTAAIPAAVENADAQEEHPAPPDEAVASPGDLAVETVENTPPVAETDTAPAPVLGSGKEDGLAASDQKESHAEHRLYVSPREAAAGPDPVADRIRKSLAETSIARSLESHDVTDADHPPSGRGEQEDSRDRRASWLSPPDEPSKS